MSYSKVAALASIAVFVLASCGGDSPSKPVAAKRPSSPSAVASAESGSGSAYGKDKGGSRSSRLELQEGIITQSDADYTTASFSPRATFHTPNLAYPFFPEIDSSRGLFLETQVGAVIVFRPAKVFDPSSGKLAPVPDDLTAWAADNEHVDAGAVESASVAGLHGMQVSGVVRSTVKQEGDCDQACLRLAPVTPKDSVWFIKGDRFRLTSVQWHGEALGILLTSDKSGFHQLTSAATKLLKTLRFH